MVTGPNRQLQRQSSQNPQSLDDTVGFHANRKMSTLTDKPIDPVNQIALAMEKTGKQKPPTITFPPQKHKNNQRKS